MSKFHSNVSRRDFMKALGVVGVGAGTAAAATPMFHDLDEVIASPIAGKKRSWWIKDLEIGKPTVEVDWNVLSRYDDGNCLHGVSGRLANFVGADAVNALNAEREATRMDGIRNGRSGYTLKDDALRYGASEDWGHVPMSYVLTDIPITVMGGRVPSYQDLGVPKYVGTPEENSRMMRAALRFFGASDVGFTELGSRERALVYTRHPNGKKIVFEQVDKAYERADAYVMPDKPLWIVSVAVQMSKEMFRHGTGTIRIAANTTRYRLWSIIQQCSQIFLYELGYQGIGYPIFHHGVVPAAADAILTGMAEAGRNDNYCISPEYGSVCGYYSLITDLPLAPTPPIDSGIFNFCHTCRKCAETCPIEAISFESEPSWDIPNSKIVPEQTPIWSALGKKVFHTDAPACMSIWYSLSCARCMGNCVFNTNPAAVHNIIKGIIGNTSMFNSVLWQADKLFGYGLTPEEEREDWWNLDLPVMGQDSTIGAIHGGYNT
ncbi:MAG: reductive dehalogenase [Dehalococcoides mccartyi]|uniref:reductive dehalogenase n=1 Tax=Dehalococcoides mccartyi TaxID=61435 RepID=UPI0008053671|nr:reductive dehalogenase [Dehalococcoides mccartyi]OBW62539.1 MAG: reductive dehalogenase [Dehalococcoides mccartyi]